MKCLESAESSLLHGNECMTHIEQGKAILEEGRRHILIADREKLTWLERDKTL